MQEVINNEDIKTEELNNIHLRFQFETLNNKGMRKHCIVCFRDEKVQQLVAHLPWGHNILLIKK